MAYLAVDAYNNNEYIYCDKPYRNDKHWLSVASCIKLPQGSIKKLTGKELTWNDEPIKLPEKSLAIESLNDKLISIRQKALKYYKERCEDCPQLEGHEDIRQEILDAFYQGAVEAYMNQLKNI